MARSRQPKVPGAPLPEVLQGWQDNLDRAWANDELIRCGFVEIRWRGGGSGFRHVSHETILGFAINEEIREGRQQFPVRPGLGKLSEFESRQALHIAGHLLTAVHGLATARTIQQAWLAEATSLAPTARSMSSELLWDRLIEALAADAELHACFPVNLGSESLEHLAYLFADGRPLDRGVELLFIHVVRHACEAELTRRWRDHPLDALAAMILAWEKPEVDRGAGAFGVVDQRDTAYRELMRRAQSSRIFPTDLSGHRDEGEKVGWIHEAVTERLSRQPDASLGELVVSATEGDLLGEGEASALTVLHRRLIDQLRRETAAQRKPTAEAQAKLDVEGEGREKGQLPYWPVKIEISASYRERLCLEYGEKAPEYVELVGSSELPAGGELNQVEIAGELGCSDRTIRNIRARIRANPALLFEILGMKQSPK